MPAASGATTSLFGSSGNARMESLLIRWCLGRGGWRRCICGGESPIHVTCDWRIASTRKGNHLTRGARLNASRAATKRNSLGSNNQPPLLLPCRRCNNHQSLPLLSTLPPLHPDFSVGPCPLFLHHIQPRTSFFLGLTRNAFSRLQSPQGPSSQGLGHRIPRSLDSLPATAPDQ